MPGRKPGLKAGLIGTGFRGRAHAVGFTAAPRLFDLPVAVALTTVVEPIQRSARERYWLQIED